MKQRSVGSQSRPRNHVRLLGSAGSEQNLTAPRKLLLEFHSPAGSAVTQVRSTLLQSSLQTLREHGLFERYVALLPKEYHEPILLTLAPSWLPVEVAMAHYRCCDQLSLDDTALQRFGETV